MNIVKIFWLSFQVENVAENIAQFWHWKSHQNNNKKCLLTSKKKIVFKKKKKNNSKNFFEVPNNFIAENNS